MHVHQTAMIMSDVLPDKAHGTMAQYLMQFADPDYEHAVYAALGPSFRSSEWVLDPKQRLARVLLHGLSGPIWGNGRRWQTSAVMPGFSARVDLNDEDLAAVAIYIRNTWGDSAGTKEPITPLDIEQIREQTRDRTTPYRAEELM
ncbi:hypothetical protein DXV75_11655 [Alteromonas aestuariivivens]|uniref:Cytochrome c n=1 Tax=Alteromonas aestuariivivens TaxID=1938339 RepID=A0A3D8M6R7_9ALTE|nr:hypothetical protein DXV75_11655 [Alteromonas aestuariivivens]